MSIRSENGMREYKRLWIAKRRADFFKNKECIKCGSTEDLELDHINPKLKKKRTDHNIWSLSEERRLKEIKKCQILCNLCHKKKTIKENYGHELYAHGIPMTYRSGCRCLKCKKWKSDDDRRYRLKKKTGE